MTKTQIAARVLIYAASALSPLIATKVAHTIARIAEGVYANVLPGKPLPPITDVVLVKFASSDVSLGIGLGLAIFMLIIVATFANPKDPRNVGSNTAQIFLAFIGPFISAVYLGAMLIATLLPLTPMGRILIKSVEQGAAGQ